MHWVICAFTVGLLGCGTEDDMALPLDAEVEADAEVDAGAEPPLDGCDGTLTWNNFADGFLSNACRGCHSSGLSGDARFGAPPGIDFDDEAQVLGAADRIYTRTVTDADMPPGGGPSPDERAAFGQWLECQMME